MSTPKLQLKVTERKLKDLNLKKEDDFIKILNEQSNFIIPFFGIVFIIIIVSYQIQSVITDSDPIAHLIKNMYLLIIPSILLFCVITYYTFDSSRRYTFGIMCITGLFSFFVIYGIIQITQYQFNTTITSVVSYSFIILGILIGLSIFHNIFEAQLRPDDTWGSFWIEMIFYLPCMFDTFIKYMTQEYANTSTRTIILFCIEIALIIGYLYIYPSYKKSIYDNGIIVLGHSAFLNNQISGLFEPVIIAGANKVATPEQRNFMNLIIEPDTTHYGYRTNYAISMWVYVNPMPLSRLGYTEETNIFCYGSGGNSKRIINELNSWEIGSDIETSKSTIAQNYHPRLSMSNVDNNYVFNFYYSEDILTHKIELPLQKWNNIVFNYVNSGVDVFINGELKLSYNFTNDMPEYKDSDDISIGDTNGIMNINANGVYGSICNIVYYKEPLTKRQIVLNYNMLSQNNPPL